MKQTLYKKLITSQLKDSDRRNREIVLNILLIGTLAVLTSFTIILCISSFFSGQPYGMRLLATLFAVVVATLLLRLSRVGHSRLVAHLLVGLYLAMATAVVILWGLNVPGGILLYGLVIVLAGILLGSAYSLYLLGLISIIIGTIQYGVNTGFIRPDTEWINTPPNNGSTFGICVIFGIIALVSWLFNHQMERSLRRAQRAEVALTRQKALLEVKVEERTRQLQAAQMEKMQQLYRFAELGQLSTGLLHDLANHLTTITLDLESLEEKTANSVLVKRAKRSIGYIDEMVNQVRDQLQGKYSQKTFGIAAEIDEMLKIVRVKAFRAHVRVEWEQPPDPGLQTQGEPSRLRQLFANLVSNAIDAYPETTANDPQRKVLLRMSATDDVIEISVSDWGQGIPKSARPKIFEPFFSTKETGMGMGLVVAKQVAEEHFGGTVTLDADKKHTVFTVKLRRAH